MNILKPDLMVNSISKINLKCFWEKNKRGIIIDLDNTLAPWNIEQVNEKADIFLKEALALKYKICLLTNAGKERTKKVAEQYQMFYIATAFKPRKKAFSHALELIGLEANQVIVIGDQLFTDILGGNRAGCYTILVPALSKREFVGTKILRLLERVIKSLNHVY